MLGHGAIGPFSDWQGHLLRCSLGPARLPRSLSGWHLHTHRQGLRRHPLQPNYIIGLMSEQNWQRGLMAKAGYTTVDWAVETHNSRMGTWRFALVSMRQACVFDCAAQFLRSLG